MFFADLNIATYIIFGFLLLLKPEKHGNSTKIMGITMFMYAIVAARYRLYDFRNPALFYKLDVFFTFFELFFSSAVTNYFLILTKNRLSIKNFFWLYMPPLIIWCIVIALYTSISNDGAIAFVRNAFYKESIALPNL